MNTTRSRFNKEFRLENLLTLKRAIANGSFKDLDTPNNEWEGAYVIITSCKDRVANSTHEEDTFVLTKHSAILSKLFHVISGLPSACKSLISSPWQITFVNTIGVRARFLTVYFIETVSLLHDTLSYL